MASYIKIEIFAYDLFHTVWHKAGLIKRKHDAIKIYKDDCLPESDVQLVCDKIFYDAVLCRRILFQKIYMEEITKEKDTYWHSVDDFYKYIYITCNRYDLFGSLNVFEKVLATCAFVINLCFYNRENENVNIITTGHICWASYFDAFIEEFYNLGGWNQLKNVSHFYTSPLTFLQMCMRDPENIIFEVSEAIENFNKLKKSLIVEEHETVSKSWVKSRIQSLHSSFSTSVVKFEGDENCMHAEHILTELKKLCSPRILEVIQYDEECSERSVFDSGSFHIPLTPTESPESKHEKNSLSVNLDEDDTTPEKLEDGLSTSFPEGNEISSKSDNSEFEDQPLLDELEELSEFIRDSLNELSIDRPHILNESVKFESISIHPNWEDMQNLSRSMTKMHLNHETLELEDISEMDFNSITNNFAVENPGLNIKDRIQINQEVSNNQYQMLENSSNGIKLASNGLSITETNLTRNKNCDDGIFENGILFCDVGESYDKEGNELSVTETNLNYKVSENVRFVNGTSLSDIAESYGKKGNGPSVTKTNSSHNKGCENVKFVNATESSNVADSYDKEMSILEWDEKHLAKNISTPIKRRNGEQEL